MSELNFSAAKCYDSRVNPAQYNKLVDMVQSLCLEPGLGYQVSRSICGTTLRIKPGAAGNTATPEPFNVSLSPVSGDDSTMNVNVLPGTVNQMLPDNLFDPSSISVSGTYYAKLAIESDGQNLTSVSIAVDDSEPDQQSATPNALPTSFDILLALIKDSKIYQTQNGSLMMVGTESFIVDADPPADPGKLTYTPYFLWNISTV